MVHKVRCVVVQARSKGFLPLLLLQLAFLDGHIATTCQGSPLPTKEYVHVLQHFSQKVLVFGYTRFYLWKSQILIISVNEFDPWFPAMPMLMD